MKIFKMFQEMIEFAFFRDESSKVSSIQSNGTCGVFRVLWIRYKNFTLCYMVLFGAFYQIMFIIFQARTFPEFSESIYSLLTLVITTTATRTFYVKQHQIFSIINRLEEVIEKRKLFLPFIKEILRIVYFRIDRRTINNSLRKSQYTSRKTVQNRLYFVSTSNTLLFNISILGSELLFVFYYRFGSRCILPTKFDMVSSNIFVQSSYLRFIR